MRFFFFSARYLWNWKCKFKSDYASNRRQVILEINASYWLFYKCFFKCRPADFCFFTHESLQALVKGTQMFALILIWLVHMDTFLCKDISFWPFLFVCFCFVNFPACKPTFSCLPTFYIYHYMSGYSLYAPAHIKFSTIAHHCEPVSAVIVIHKPLPAPGTGPSWQPCSMLRLSNRHYVNWHVQCNSLIRLN